MAHGTYDAYWSRQEVLQHMKDIGPAVLNVAGWFDAEDFYGPMSIYRAIERNDADNRSTLIVGPWRHGGWARGRGDSLGEISFGAPTAEFYQREVEFPFFEHYLRGADPGTDAVLPEAIVFETGGNEWRRYESWPPPGVEKRSLYLRGGGALSFEPPSDDEVSDAGYDEFVSDPDKPVPFSTEIRTSQGHTWMIEDQRFASRRPDVLAYMTEPLEQDVVIAGPILAKLKVATTGTDADWIVKLIDVFPGDTPDNGNGTKMGGFQMLLAGEVLRSKFRNGFEKPEPLVPGAVTPIEFDLRDKFHRFLAGHRIMVQIQSTWFPVIDRNPQTFCDIYHATEADFHKAAHRVLRSPEHASHLELLVQS
jgi:putative CocE/NonD family hydrolase